MKLGLLEVDAAILESVLGLPETVEVYGCEWDFYRCRVRLFIKGETLDEVEPGSALPVYRCIYTKEAGATSCKLERTAE